MDLSSTSPRPLVILARPIFLATPAGEAGVSVRSYRGESEISDWLKIQNAVSGPRARPWGVREFRRELLARSWWHPDRLLMARVPRNPIPVGTMAFEPVANRPWAQLHWLAVDPTFQRRGIAGALVEAAAVRARQLGCVELRAETLRSWSGAVRFYEAIGFKELAVRES